MSDVIKPPSQLLRPGEIHIWRTLSDAVNAELIEFYNTTLLVKAEQAAARRFHFSPDRRHYIITRALVRTVLSRYCSIRPADWHAQCYI